MAFPILKNLEQGVRTFSFEARHFAPVEADPPGVPQAGFPLSIGAVPTIDAGCSGWRMSSAICRLDFGGESVSSTSPGSRRWRRSEEHTSELQSRENLLRRLFHV